MIILFVCSYVTVNHLRQQMSTSMSTISKEKRWFDVNRMFPFSIWRGGDTDDTMTAEVGTHTEPNENKPSSPRPHSIELKDDILETRKCDERELTPTKYRQSKESEEKLNDDDKRKSESEASFASTMEEVKDETPQVEEFKEVVPTVKLVLNLNESTANELSEPNLETAQAEPYYTLTDFSSAQINMAPVYSSVNKFSLHSASEPPQVPEPDWDEFDDEPEPIPISLVASPEYWDAKVAKLRRERKKQRDQKGKIHRAWKGFKDWWAVEKVKIGEVSDRVREKIGGGSEVEEEDEDDFDSGRGGAGSPAPTILSSRSKVLSQDYLMFQGQNGFEDLRKYIKQGGDFCKELAAILHERSEAEAQYAKTLAKLSNKLVKATRDSVGSVNTAWHRIGAEMDAQSEVHRAFANSLSEEVVKPLRQLVDSQHRIRKSVETAVDKSGKSLAEWRTTEGKAKKNSFACARENEKLRCDSNNIGNGGILESPKNRLSTSSLQLHKQPEKEMAKLETKRKKAEELVKKADVEYYTVCLRSERARLEWESAVVRGSHCFQVLEEERLRSIKDLAIAFLSGFQHIGPKLTEISNRISDPVNRISLDNDIEAVVTLKTATLPIQEQMLPDFYAEHMNLAMNRERRKIALVKILQLIRQDLERERRGKTGVENLARALKQTTNFANDDSQHNVQEKLHHMRSMLTFLEATRYKVQCALADIEGRNKGSHPLANHIHTSRDRQGCQQSVLKVPQWVHKENLDVTDIAEWTVDCRGTADGTSVQPDSDFDEFSSQGSEKDYETSVIRVPESDTSPPSRCKALYNYTANLYDELSLNPGDIINIHDKQPDGWWLGELNGVVGIFPATYVEEIK